MLPEIEKVHKRKERLLKKQHRQALLLDNYMVVVRLAPGCSLRDRKHVTYTFGELEESCPSTVTELLEYVARFTEHSDFMCKHRNEAILDGSDINGRRVKQRL